MVMKASILEVRARPLFECRQVSCWRIQSQIPFSSAHAATLGRRITGSPCVQDNGWPVENHICRTESCEITDQYGGAYQDLLCLESMEGKHLLSENTVSFLQFKHSLRMPESDPIVFYSRCSRRCRKIILLRATPNARICLNLAKDNPHIEQTTRQIVLAEQFCFNSVILHCKGMCDPA